MALVSHSRPVLIVDDDHDIREAMHEALCAEGYPVAVAHNGQEALELLRRQGPPSLILVDLMMPVMDGQTFVQCLRQDPVHHTVPVFLVTASGRAAMPGTQGVLGKPFDLDALLALVAAHVPDGDAPVASPYAAQACAPGCGEAV
jgi:CheY-like chemotaxis protein